MRFRAGLQVPGGGQEQEEEGSSVAALPVLTETARHECGWDLAIWRPLGTLTCTRFWPGWISEGTSAKGDEDEAGASRDTEENFGVGVVPSFPRGEITHTACVHEGHSDPAAATAELGAEEERHKNVSGSEIYCCNLQNKQ